MIITKIERQKRHPDRVNIYLDGEFALGLHKEVIVKFGLRKGDELQSELMDKLNSTEEFTLAKQKALRFLNYRMRSEKEVRTKLIEKEFHLKTIDQVLEYLRSLDFINDIKFAKAFINDFQIKKPAGKRLLQQKLRQKGISNSIIQDILGKVDDSIENKSALEAAKKQLKKYRMSRKKIEPMKQQQQIVRFLQNRGFTWSIISTVLKNIFHNKEIDLEV